MNTTAEALVARRIGNHQKVAGSGPPAQFTTIGALTSKIEGRGGWVQLAATGAGTYEIELPLPNTVSVTIVDMAGHNHVLRLALESGPSKMTFNGVAGNWVELVPNPTGQNWQVREALGIKMT